MSISIDQNQDLVGLDLSLTCDLVVLVLYIKSWYWSRVFLLFFKGVVKKKIYQRRILLGRKVDFMIFNNYFPLSTLVPHYTSNVS